MTERYFSESEEDTIRIGREIGKKITPGSVLCLEGDLGAGKTTLTRGIALSVTECDGVAVSSPTFSYLNIYEGKNTLYHYDLYRLASPSEFFAMGFEENLETEGICCIEWAEKIASFLPSTVLKIQMKFIDSSKREIVIT